MLSTRSGASDAAAEADGFVHPFIITVEIDDLDRHCRPNGSAALAQKGARR